MPIQAQEHALENPVTVQYLKENLTPESPRLILNKRLENDLRQKLRSDTVVQNLYQALQYNAKQIQKQPLLERKMIGRRLLSTSREMLYRMNILGMTYRMERDPKVLDRINRELLAVCNFSDWNPSHYLDVAEMSLAVALALDWTAGQLPDESIKLGKKALIEKGLLPSYDETGNTWWIKGTNNWNQVCHAGMIAASLVIAEENPELAVKTIRRALEGIPYALAEYEPDGVYPEGSTYWGYGTGFTVLTIAMLESALGTDFGISKSPGFMESALFRVLTVAPSGGYYNFADCGDRRANNGDLTLAWFATKTGNSMFFELDRFSIPAEKMGKLSRHAGASLVWISQFEGKKSSALPLAWKGSGTNPIAIIRGDHNDSNQYYLGCKGGRGSVNHGNMDAGSFVFELNGVRWVIDPGNQPYHELEKTGFELWGRCQECERWRLLTKNNFGHSTLTVNNELHQVDGQATILDFKTGSQPEVSFDLSPVFGNQLSQATRRFVKEGTASLLIEDEIKINDETRSVTWQLITTAEVQTVEGGAILSQQGKKLKMEVLSHPDLSIAVISLDPPPLKLDRRIKNLKRIELRFPPHRLQAGNDTIRVRLSAD